MAPKSKKKKVSVWIWDACSSCSSGSGFTLSIESHIRKCGKCCQCCTCCVKDCKWCDDNSRCFFQKRPAPFAWRLEQCQVNSISKLIQLSNDHTESEAVFRKHPREPVHKKHLTPQGKYRAICKVFSFFAEGAWKEATGCCLIERGIIATAGHCVYDEEYGCAIAIEVHISYHGATADLRPTHEVRMAADVAVHRGWYDNFSRENDIALIRLRTPFDEVLPLKWTACPPKGEKVEIGLAGYPLDIPGGREGRYMYESKGLADWDLEKNAMLFHRLDTFPGNSGSPVFRIGDDEELVVIGVHVASSMIPRPTTVAHTSKAGKLYRVNKVVAIGHRDNSFEDLRQAILYLRYPLPRIHTQDLRRTQANTLN